MADHIEYDGVTGEARSFTGEGAVNVFAMAVMASGLRLYAKTGMKPNRAYTPHGHDESSTGHAGQHRGQQQEHWRTGVS